VEHGDFESREILLAKLEEAKKIITEQDQTIKVSGVRS
jgi:hypothetical protein